MSLRLLLVEDDSALRQLIAAGMSEAGIGVEQARSVREARAALAATTFDLMVLDIGLPDATGLTLCTELRARGIATPILLLTARDAIADRVKGLEAGADDYLVKPFAFAELLARLRALARRAPLQIAKQVNIAHLSIDLVRRIVTRNGQTVELTAKEYALLEILATDVGQLVSRPAITAHVWDDNHDPFDNVLEVLIRRLRRKIDIDAHTSLIQTVRGMGYRLGA